MNKSKKIFLIIPLVLMLIIIANNTVLGFENFSTDIMQDLGDGSKIESANKAVNRVWGTIVLILQMLAVTAIILAGVRYMFASADGKADIKKQTIGLVVGAVLVFGASIVIDFVVNVTKEITDGKGTGSSTHSSTFKGAYDITEEEIFIDDIIFKEKEISLKIGEDYTIETTIKPSDATDKNIIYSSSDTGIASVTQNGVVSAIKGGTVTITGKSNDGKVVETCTINISNSITVVFNRNVNNEDTNKITQVFTKEVKGNKFGYNTDGTLIWDKTGEFGYWNKPGCTLIGWSTDRDSKSIQYDTYNNVVDDWIQKVIDKQYAGQTKSGIIDLYAVWAENVDLVLFWGQSNMVGYAGRYADEKNLKDDRDLTGIIDSDILAQYKKYNYVSVQVPKNMAYDYKVNSSTRLEPITSDTKVLGETLLYSGDELKTSNIWDCSIESSYGTNIIPQFAKTYVEETGHKLVTVFAANGGEKISNFLPNSTVDPKNQHIYEALKLKYLSAVKYLQENGYYIKNRFYVVYQGCSDTHRGLVEGTKYYDTYLIVHNSLKNDLGLQFGALVETGGKISYWSDEVDSTNKIKRPFIESIHKQQVDLYTNNDDIILGSSFGYNAYLNKYSQVFCKEDVNGYDNSIHLTSAGLSQIGKETAMNVSKYIK